MLSPQANDFLALDVLGVRWQRARILEKEKQRCNDHIAQLRQRIETYPAPKVPAKAQANQIAQLLQQIQIDEIEFDGERLIFDQT